MKSPVLMVWAIVIILASVLAGTLLALAPRDRDAWMGPVRTFALMSALSVVILHLLPEALSEVGAFAVLAFLAGLVLPEMLGKLGVLLWRAGRHEPAENEPDRRRDYALEASYFGLLLHRFGDGIGIGAFTGEMFAGHGREGVITALAAHCVPVVAIVVLTFDSVRGRGHALWRAGGLGVASIAGVFIARSVPLEVFHEASAWVSAFVSGMLIHVVTHDVKAQLPKRPKERIWDILAAGLGIYVSFLGQGAHHAHEDVGHFEHVLVDFAIETGPLLVLGLFIGALLTTFGARIPARFFQSRGTVWDAARGTVIGGPLPLCSCSVLPISAALKARGAGPALVVGFLLATPELGFETFALSVRFLGWEFAWFRLIGALLVAFVAAVVVALMVRGEPVKTDRNEDLVAEQSEGPWPTRVLAAFDELFQHVGAWMILGVVAAALLEVALPKDAFAELDSTLLQFVVITLVAIPSYVCAPSATPLAAVLLAKGISPGAVLVGLLLGPATNVATIVFLRRWFGTWAAAVGVGAAVVVSWTFGFILDHFGVLNVPASALVHQHEHGVVWEWLALISGLLLVRAVYRTGARGFMATIAGEHGHEHGTGEHLHDVVGGHGHGDHEHGGHEHGGHGHGGHGHGAHDHDGHGHGGHGHGGHGHGQ